MLQSQQQALNDLKSKVPPLCAKALHPLGKVTSFMQLCADDQTAMRMEPDTRRTVEESNEMHHVSVTLHGKGDSVINAWQLSFSFLACTAVALVLVMACRHG